jgi:zinc transport system substrate-binding protein
MKNRGVPLLALTMTLALFLLTAPSLAEGLPVFVSVLPQKYLAERVAGERVAVSVMVGPGQSPATYEPTPRQMARLAAARIYFRIGVPFEGVWADRLAAANPSMKIIDTGQGIGAGGQDGRDDKDPHLWTSPLTALQIARTMKDALVAADPEHRTEFESGFNRLAADLQGLDREIRELLGGLEKRKFMVFHPSWGHFADAYGLEQVAIERGGREPGARWLADLIDMARREGIRVIFVQEQFSRRNAEAVARAVAGRVVSVDPLAEDYIDNLRLTAEQFAEAMR